jgi:hypothetical protein
MGAFPLRTHRQEQSAQRPVARQRPELIALSTARLMEMLEATGLLYERAAPGCMPY